MRAIFLLAAREVRAAFRSPAAYVFLITFLVLNAFLFFRSFFLIAQADMRTFFILLPWVFLFYVPAIAMGKWSEEFRHGTDELLFALPLSVVQLVLSKFLSGLCLVVFALLCTMPLALIVHFAGPLDWGQVASAYLGALCVGALYLAIGLVVSALTRSQMVAFIVTVIVCFTLLIVGEPIVTMVLPSELAMFVQDWGVSYHFGSMSRGVLDTRDLGYFVVLVSFFLWCNCQIIKVRRA